MITMITGLPGMGKTALVVSMLIDEVNKGVRPLFVMGLTDLSLEHIPAPPIPEWTEKRQDKDDPNLYLDYFTFPPNSILIIDEAQRVYRARSSGSKVPPIVSALETHRHTGLDIWLLTQKPLLVDSHVRELVGRHIHIKDTLLGRYLYEWAEFQDVNSKSNLSDAIKRKFSPPKKAFQHYKSAQLHTKQPRRFHQAFIVLAFMLCLVAFLAFRLANGFVANGGQIPTDEIKTLSDTSQIIDAKIIPANTDVLPTTPPPPVIYPHPYMGYDFTISGTISSKRFTRTYYSLTNGSKQLFLNNSDLEKMGYVIKQENDCSAFLFFKGAEIVATCTIDNNSARQARQRVGGDVVGETPPPLYPIIDNSDNLTPSPSF